MEFLRVVRKRKWDKQEPIKPPTSLVLSLEESLGCIQRHLHCNSFICGSLLLYLNGNLIILHNIIQSSKKFIQRLDHEQNQTVTALSCHSDTQITIAIATISKKYSVLSVYNDHSDTVYTYMLPANQQIIDIGFVNATQIIALTNKSNLLLRRDPRVCASNEQLQKFQLQYQFARICEITINTVLLCGPTGISQIMLMGQDIETIPLIKDLHAIGCISYQNNICLMLTSDSVISYKENKFTQQFNLSKISNEGLKASCIVKFSRGFFLGHSNKLAVSMFLFQNGVIRYANTYGLNEKVKGRIISLHVSFDQMYIAATTLIGDAQTNPGEDIPQGSFLQNMLINLTNVSTERTITNPFNRIFKNHLEYGPIQTLRGATIPHCLSLVGSNILDYTYEEYFKLLIKFNLNEVVLDIAMHPLGYQIVCLFKDCLRVFYRLERDLVQIHKISQICSYAQYSDGGLLAVALINASHHEIVILDAIKFQTIKVIQCFSSKHAINKIMWKHDDSQLHVYAGNQQFYIINPQANTKLIEFFERKKSVSCFHYESEINHMFVSFTDGLLRIFACKVDMGLFGKAQQYQLPWAITTICVVKKKTIVFGTTTGKVVWASWPFNPSSYKLIGQLQPDIPQFEQIALSFEPINQLFLANLKYLVAGVANGTLYVLRLKHRRDKLLVDMENNHEWCKFKDIVMQSKSSLDQTKDKLKNLLEKRGSYISELQEMKKEEENRYALEVRELAISAKDQQRKNLGEIIETMSKNKEIRATIQKEQDLLLKKKDMGIKDWEQHTDKEMLKVYRDNECLEAELAQLKLHLNEQYDTAQEQFQRNIRDIQEQFALKYTTSQMIVKEMKQKLCYDQLKRDLIKNEKNEEIKVFNAKKRQKMVQQERELTQINNDFKAKVSKLQRQIDRFDLRKDFLDSKKKYLQKQLNVEQSQKRSLQKLKNSLNLELVHLEDATNKREEMIRQLSSRNDKLTGFRQVYRYLQQHLESQTGTLREYMAVLSDQIMKINSELVGILNQNRKRHELVKTHQNVKIRLDAINKEQMTPLSRLSSIINSVIYQLSQLNQNISKDWKPQATRILDELHNQMVYLQTLSTNSRMTSVKQNKFLESMQEHNLEQVKNNLTEQKKYLQLNIKRFSANQRLLQVDLADVHVKMQAKNSNLITECNILKEKLNKKRKCLNQQLNNVKTGENLLQNIEKSYKEVVRPSRPSTGYNLCDVFPVVAKEMRKNSNAPHLRITHHHRSKQNSIDTDTKCQTILNIRRLNSCGKTITHRLNYTRHLDDTVNETEHIFSKPNTNQGSRTALGKSRGKLIARHTVTGEGGRRKTRDIFHNSVGASP